MKPPRVEVKGEPSFLSGPGPFGTHAFMHCAPRRDGSIEVVTLRAERGVAVDVAKEVTSRTKLRASQEELKRRMRLYFAPAPGGYVASRMLDAWEAGQGRERPWGPGAVSAMASLAREDGPHPSTALDGAAGGARPNAPEILTEPEGLMLLPRPALLEMVTSRMTEVMGAAEDLRGAAMQTVLHESLDAHYDRAERAALATSLRDLALVFLASRKPERALDAVSAAIAVSAASPLTTPPHAVEFLTMLLYKALSVAESASRNR